MKKSATHIYHRGRYCFCLQVFSMGSVVDCWLTSTWKYHSGEIVVSVQDWFNAEYKIVYKTYKHYNTAKYASVSKKLHTNWNYTRVPHMAPFGMVARHTVRSHKPRRTLQVVEYWTKPAIHNNVSKRQNYGLVRLQNINCYIGLFMASNAFMAEALRKPIVRPCTALLY